MVAPPIIGNCRQQLSQPTTIEQKLLTLLNCDDDQLLVLYHHSELAIIACRQPTEHFYRQLLFAWQQLCHSALVVIDLAVNNDTAPLTNISNISDWLEQLLLQALQQQASDLHLEPHYEEFVIRLRIAGQLITFCRLSHEQGKQVATRCKVLARLDITEQFLPQDGRFSVMFPDHGQRDFRLSCCPVLNGEKLVLRSLGTLQQLPSLTELGMAATQLLCVQAALQRQAGLVLVTGPTGSGKTSTLYAMLKRLNHRQLNICTVEDPIELRFDGVNQVPVSQQLSFAKVLRALLRQDPDVLLVGEIRDAETAKIAIQAAQTGHLVLATLHTNSAIDSIQRLRSLGLPTNEVRTALSVLISQRLLRKLCPSCKGDGCRRCQQGYYGQLAAFEVVPWRSELLKGDNLPNPDALNQLMRQHKLPSLAEHARQLATAQLTSHQQAQRLSISDYEPIVETDCP